MIRDMRPLGCKTAVLDRVIIRGDSAGDPAHVGSRLRLRLLNPCTSTRLATLLNHPVQPKEM
jgi:hypothetical protein